MFADPLEKRSESRLAFDMFLIANGDRDLEIDWFRAFPELDFVMGDEPAQKV